jgi:glycosyltransferase involved in cell wall biosynthesis
MRLRSAWEQGVYSVWTRGDRLTAGDRAEMMGDLHRMRRLPRISVVVPTYNTPEPLLRRMVESVRGQLYPHWELCIADDASTEPHVRPVLEAYAQEDSRIRCIFRSENGHISRASNSALALATGEFVAFLDHDDELREHTLFHVAKALEEYPDADLLYSDEDKIDDNGRRFDPAFKPDYTAGFLLEVNYICHLAVYRRSLLVELGGLRSGFEGAQDHDLALRAVERTAPERIHHIPTILYHWRSVPGSTAGGVDEKPYAWEAGVRAVQEAMARRGITGVAERGPVPGRIRIRKG